MNIPRNLNGNIVYDLISSDSIVITSKDNLSSIKIDKGILVNNAEKDNDVPSFQSYNGILYYDNNGTLTSTTNLASNSIIYTNNDSSISQFKFYPNKLFYVDSNGNLSNYPIEGYEILYVKDGTLSSVNIGGNINNLLLYVNKQDYSLSTIPLEDNSILYTNNNNEINQLKYNTNQIISTDGSKNLQGYNLSANSILYTKSDKSISQLTFTGNQIISTNGSGNLQGYTLGANSIINTNGNGEINQTTLNANSIIYIDNDKKINFISKNNGILNTYNFDGNTVSSTNPQFTDKIVLNNCEIVTDNGRIIDNYLIYGKSGGLSNINIPKAENSPYEYYYIVNADVNAGENAVNVSSSSQIYTDLYDKEYNNNKDNEAQTIVFNAIPICTSPDDKIMNLNVLVPNAYEGNYYINSDGDKFSLKLFSDGSILPTQLKVQEDSTSSFNYRTQDILTVGQNVQTNAADEVFDRISRSTVVLDKPYLSGSGWADLKTVKFLNSNNCSTTAIINYGNNGGPLVVSNTGNIYKVTLPTNNKYVLTGSCFSQLTVDGSDLQITKESTLNLNNILQINDNNIIRFNNTNIRRGILHTDDQGNITFTQLDAEDIPNNSITSNKIALNSITGDNIANGTITASEIVNNTITGLKLDFEDSLNSSSWSNIIIDSRNNLIKNQNNVLTTDTKYGVLDYHGEIKSLTANLISEGTMSGARIENGSITSNHLTSSSVTGLKLSLSSSLASSSWSNIIIDSNNKLIKRNNTRVNNSYKYGVIDYRGDIKSLTANLITSGTFNINVIPGLSASKIIAGTFDVDRIPGLSASKIIAGTFDVDRIPNLNVSKITGEFNGTRITDSTITGSKLSFNDTTPSGSWNNILLDNNNNLIKRNASVTNYGVFDKYGIVTDLNAQVFNSVGLKFFTPTTDEGKIDESSYLATRFIIYTDNFYDIPFSPDYYQIFNYKNITDSANILYDFKTGLNSAHIPDGTNSTSQINSSVNTTYTTLYSILKNNINTTNKYLRFKTSLYIDSIEFPNDDPKYVSTINNGEQNYKLSILSDANSKYKLVIGVYTNIYTLTNNINSENKNVILIRDKLLVDDQSNFTLLGYIFVDMTQINGNKIQLNKEYNFDSTINYDYRFALGDLIDNIIPSVITFKPLYYIDGALKISSLFYNKLDTDIQDFENNILFNDNIFSFSTISNRYTTSQIKFENNQLKFKRTDFVFENNTLYTSNNKVIYTFKQTPNTDLTDSTYIIIKDTGSEPIEKDIKINLKPTTRYSQIMYTNQSSNQINYKFSLFSIDLTVTDYVGEYPSIIQ